MLSDAGGATKQATRILILFFLSRAALAFSLYELESNLWNMHL